MTDKKHFWHSLGMKLLILFVLFVSAFVAGTGLMAYRTASSAIVRQAESGLLQTIVQAGEKMDMQLRYYGELANQLMRHAAFTENLFQFAYPDLPREERDRRIAMTRSILDQLALSDPHIRDIHLFPLADPVPVIGTQETAAPEPGVPWLEEIRQAAGLPVWFPAAEGGYAGSQAMPVFAFGQLFGKQNVGSNEYALLVQIEASVLEETVGDIRLGNRSVVALANRNGQPFIVHSEDTENADADLGEIHLPSLAQEQGHLTREGADGKEIVLYRSSPVSGWTLLGMVPQRELTAAARGIQTTAWIAVCVSILLALAAGVRIARWIGSRLDRLRKLMGEAATGNFSGRLNQRGKDEIGMVSEAYDRMAKQIGELIGEIRQSVGQVTEAVDRVTEAARRTALSAKEIQSASAQIAAGAEELAVHSERTNHRVGEMTGRLHETSRFQQSMFATTQEVDEACRIGNVKVQSLLGRTRETETRLVQVSDRLKRLKDSMDSIHRLLDLMTRIAKQTTILSLNASIQAAHSDGKHSAFRVIAEEIRKLAEQSNHSIREAGEMLETLRSGVSGAVGAMTETMPFFQELAIHVRDVCGIFENVQNQMQRLLDRTAEVNASVAVMQETQTGLSRSAEEVAAVAEQSSASSRQVAALCAEQQKISDELVALAENMNEWSKRLERHVSRFQI